MPDESVGGFGDFRLNVGGVKRKINTTSDLKMERSLLIGLRRTEATVLCNPDDGMAYCRCITVYTCTRTHAHQKCAKNICTVHTHT
jgi:hypothetical protein